MKIVLPVVLVFSVSTDTLAGPATIEITEDVLADKIHGGLVGQILGNLNGLVHEAKYLDKPGAIASYTPHLPEGARTDDDTDIEWVYITEMAGTGETFIPPGRIVELWKRHITKGIWCANRYAAGLMELGVEPPLTGRIPLNPWADFNISGQFVCEAFGLVTPGMPRAAAEIGTYYTHVAVDGEPIQATQLFTSMIASAFVTEDLNALIEIGMAAVDARSEIHRVVADVRRWHAENPDDWRTTWKRIHGKYFRHGNTVRDWNGYELNTAAVIGSLLYGKGDFVETVRLAFCFGWDADCNAATAGCIIGVIKGRRWMDHQGWVIKDIYRNTTRPGMPMDETITRYAERLLRVSEMVVLRNGGEWVTREGRKALRIRTQKPVNIESLPDPIDRLADLRREWIPRIEKDLEGEAADTARAAYLALCLDEFDRLARQRPSQWKAACDALRAHGDIIKNIHKTAGSRGRILQDKATMAGFPAPVNVPRTGPSVTD
ncbi:MAG TPA: ADP-ribosylglycohydrolase family protein [Phycisphaerae bacterium]|nr:ADP-ribosylglycohydrolase family protein [Phycisphaerae bacterium]